ncbi:MAG: carbamoyltransferase [Planctomycetes bacterium]|nr:carbamoyltransferase [Planctomycetota bacterium]
MLILGINAFHPDSSACLLRDGDLVAFAEEERFNRIKHCAGFPSEAIKYCLNQGGATISDINYITVSRDPKANISRRIASLIRHPKRTLYVLKERVGNVLQVYDIKSHLAKSLEISKDSIKAKVYNIEHHLAHIASAYYPSGLNSSLAVTIDAFGDFASMIVCTCEGNTIRTHKRVLFPHSLGIWYTAICQLIGFSGFGDEGKVMALASYGQPSLLDKMNLICHLDNDNLFKMNLDFFRHHSEGVSMTWGKEKPSIGRLYNENLVKLFNTERQKGSPIEQIHKDIASSLQVNLENIAVSLIKNLKSQFNASNLCMAGGVCYNCVMNGQILKKVDFDNVFIQAASGDSGTSLGSALFLYHQILNKPRTFTMEHAYYGPSFSDNEIENTLRKHDLKFRKSHNIAKETAEQIAKSKIVGWFQGRMEVGPRALGNRSIVANPKDPSMKDILNNRIKHREPFRPFAPSILLEHRNTFMEMGFKSPFMITIDWIKREKQHEIPSAVHIDGTCRLQTVNSQANPIYWNLINEFHKISGVPIVLNTSFNEDEPIVCTPDNAINCFIKTKMDILSIGSFIVEAA